MVSRLVADMLRRFVFGRFAFLAMMLALAWEALPKVQPSVVVAASLSVSYVIGPLSMLGWLATPVVPYLPVSRRDVWRAAWLMGTVLPAAFTTALKLPGVLAGATIGWSTLTLSTAMDFLFAGAGCAVVAATNAGGAVGRDEVGARLVALLVLVIGVFLPSVIRTSLPITWAQVSPFHIGVFAAAAALTVRSALHTPRGAWKRTRRADATASTTPPVLPVQRGGLSGLPRLWAHELASSAGLSFTLAAALLSIAWVVRLLSGLSTNVDAFLVSQRVFVFDPRALASEGQRVGIFNQLAWFAFFAAAVSARFPEALRQLRVLPIGRHGIHTLLLAWPFVVWTGVWVVLAMLHLLMSHPIVILQWPLLLALVGLSQLSLALRLRFPKLVPPVILVSLLLPLGQMTTGGTAWILVSVAAGTAVTAVALNTSALARSATYKRANTWPAASPTG